MSINVSNDERRTKRIAFLLLCTFWCLNYLMFISEWGYNLLSPYSVYINLFVIFVNIAINKTLFVDKRIVKLIVINIIYAFLTLILNINNSGIGWIVNLINFFLMILFTCNFTVSYQIPRWMIAVNLFFFLFFCVISKGAFIRYQQNAKTVNPNTIGFLIFMTSCYILMFIEIKKYNVSFASRLLIIILTSLAIYGTKSRGSFFGYLLFSLYYILSQRITFLKNKKTLLFVYFAIIICGILFPVIYLQLIKNGIAGRFAIEGKVVYSGREIIWRNFYDRMSIWNWIIGYGSNADFYTGHQLNMHNVYLALIVNYGILGLTGFFLIIKQILFRKKCLRYTGGEFVYIIFFLAVLAVSYVEVTLIWAPVLLLILFPISFFGGVSDDNI